MRNVEGPASRILQPGDRLPPQVALHGTRWQTTGYTVGRRSGDVRRDLPVESGRVLCFNMAGQMLSLDPDINIIVERSVEV